MAGLVRMSTPGDSGMQIEEMEFPADLKRQLFAGFSESKYAPIVTTGRQVEQGAGGDHRGLATRALRYSP